MFTIPFEPLQLVLIVGEKISGESKLTYKNKQISNTIYQSCIGFPCVRTDWNGTNCHKSREIYTPFSQPSSLSIFSAKIDLVHFITTCPCSHFEMTKLKFTANYHHSSGSSFLLQKVSNLCPLYHFL